MAYESRMRLRTAVSGALSLAIIATGCGSKGHAEWSEDDHGLRGAGGAPMRDAGAADTGKDGLIETVLVRYQPVPWATLKVGLVGARLVYPDASGSGSGLTYAELDVRITNGSAEDVDYTTRDTWDLRLPSGQRVTSANPLGILIPPRQTMTTTLRYVVPGKIDLVDASLILEGPTRGKLEPEVIPLNDPWVQAYPLRSDLYVGTPFTLGTDADGNRSDYQVTDLRIDLNDPIVNRTLLDQRIVRIDLHGTNHGSAALPIDEGSFHLDKDGLSYPPEWATHDSVAPGDYFDATAIFSVPADTTQFNLTVASQATPLPTGSVFFPINVPTEMVLVK